VSRQDDDFEIRVGLRARVLRARTPPEARTVTDGDVALAREQTRNGLPAEMQPSERYADVAVERRVSGRIVSRREGES
jgi:hypothetical protein